MSWLLTEKPFVMILNFVWEIIFQHGLGPNECVPAFAIYSFFFPSLLSFLLLLLSVCMAECVCWIADISAPFMLCIAISFVWYRLWQRTNLSRAAIQRATPTKKKIHRKINWSTNLIGQFPCCRSELIVGWFSILIENMVICGIIPKVPVVCAWKSQNHSFQYEARLLMLFLLLLFGCDCIKCRMLMYLESLIIIIEPCSKYFDCFRHTKSQQIYHLDIDIYYQQIIRMGCRCFFSRSLCSLKSIWPRGKEEEKRFASWINDKTRVKTLVEVICW